MDKEYIKQQIEKEIKDREDNIKLLWKDFKGSGYFLKSEREQNLKSEIRGLYIALEIINN